WNLDLSVGMAGLCGVDAAAASPGTVSFLLGRRMGSDSSLLGKPPAGVGVERSAECLLVAAGSRDCGDGCGPMASPAWGSHLAGGLHLSRASAQSIPGIICLRRRN